MRIHYLQHVPFENSANIEVWAKKNGHTVSVTKLYEGEVLPAIDQFQWLIIMGGPMNIYEEADFPWLREEKKFIAQAIESEKIVLGICLGAQLIADVLGGKVVKNNYKEIGWYPVYKTSEAKGSEFFSSLPDEFMAFHWHGDTFDIPPNAKRLAFSKACKNQAFQYNDRVMGLQFHLESSATSITKLIENCGEEMVDGEYIQKADEVLSKPNYIEEIESYMEILLTRLESKANK